MGRALHWLFKRVAVLGATKVAGSNPVHPRLGGVRGIALSDSPELTRLLDRKSRSAREIAASDCQIWPSRLDANVAESVPIWP